MLITQPPPATNERLRARQTGSRESATGTGTGWPSMSMGSGCRTTPPRWVPAPRGRRRRRGNAPRPGGSAAHTETLTVGSASCPGSNIGEPEHHQQLAGGQRLCSEALGDEQGCAPPLINGHTEVRALIQIEITGTLDCRSGRCHVHSDQKAAGCGDHRARATTTGPAPGDSPRSAGPDRLTESTRRQGCRARRRWWPGFVPRRQVLPTDTTAGSRRGETMLGARSCDHRVRVRAVGAALSWVLSRRLGPRSSVRVRTGRWARGHIVPVPARLGALTGTRRRPRRSSHR